MVKNKMFQTSIITHNRGLSSQYYVLIVKKENKVFSVHTSKDYSYICRMEKRYKN